MDVNFIKNVAQSALNSAESILNELLPGGKVKGNEYVCGSISGEPGHSCSVNMRTGKWADFSTGDKGGDLVSLYAKAKGINNLEAAKELSQKIGHIILDQPPRFAEKPAAEAIKPPADSIPNFDDKILGPPTHTWTYRDQLGEPLFYICRYEDGDKKQLKPFTYTTDGKWVRRGWQAPRPLYGLELINKYDRVLLVEGEKAADAARVFASKHYAVMTWPNGVNSVDKVDWSPIFGKEIIIWPDHDEEGRKAAARISGVLLDKCPSVKIIQTLNDNLPDGWDAADSGFDWAQFYAWAKPKLKLVENKPAEPEPDIQPVPMPSQPPPVTNNILVTSDDVENLTTKMSPNETRNIDRCGLQTTNNKRPIENMLNVGKIIAVDFSGKFWFDEFYRSFYTSINGIPEPLNDKHILDFQATVQAFYGLRKISKSMITDAIISTSYSNIKNAAKDYFLSLQWDGLPRMEDFFANACGADDSPLNQAISIYFFSSIMARVFGSELDPIYGNKVDSMLIIEGDQGIAKGMFLKTLIGKQWHYEVSRGTKDKDFFQDMRGKLIGEVAELASFDSENLDVIKRMITCQTDRLRVSYGKESQDFDRTCILVGTTNKETYLTDETGNRRFLPIKANKIDLKYVSQNREQVFAEALVYYKENVETWWDIPKDLLVSAQANRIVSTVSDEYKFAIEAWMKANPFISSTQIWTIWTDCFKQDLAKLTQKHRNDISAALKVLGWQNKVEWDNVNRKSVRNWVKG